MSMHLSYLIPIVFLTRTSKSVDEYSGELSVGFYLRLLIYAEFLEQLSIRSSRSTKEGLSVSKRLTPGFR